MSAKLVFISQPMKDKSDKDIVDERNRFLADPQICNHILDTLGGVSGFKIIDSMLEHNPTSDIKSIPVYYLGKSLELLSRADLVVFMPGWEHGNGCVMEHHACILYGISHLDF